MKIGTGLLAVVSGLHTVVSKLHNGVKSTADVVADFAEAEITHGFAKKMNKADALRGRAAHIAAAIRSTANKMEREAQVEIDKGLSGLERIRDKIGL